jgi:predicted house-cleaning noncanonical NTP pyrophosphatase (MazG superfamily)|tara:strand:+ start:2163 stop:2471 length:309 start_codon:yes stop_codon:yes gene_type:complete
MSKKFDKLVRDKIPQIINENGKSCKFRIADRTEYRAKLIEKLMEETIEFISEPSIEELADIQEVIDALIVEHKWSSLKAAAQYKKVVRGGFQDRIILEEVSG